MIVRECWTRDAEASYSLAIEMLVAATRADVLDNERGEGRLRLARAAIDQDLAAPCGLKSGRECRKPGKSLQTPT
jgi:hypothetical protein